ncbi:MAG TPA: hypothetical protein VH092_03195, partial [Urbifossiella sp.]|nr:hypothetical protein [Urbifossiella sp.]
MSADFADIRLVGLDEEHTTRADPTQPLYDVHFVLSAPPPAGWARFAQAAIGQAGVAGRRAWPQAKYFVVRCAIDDVERVLAARSGTTSPSTSRPARPTPPSPRPVERQEVAEWPGHR